GSLVALAGFQRWGTGVDHAFQLGHVALTSAWAALGVLALVIALVRRSDGLRRLAIAWLALVSLKTASFDSVMLSEMLRSYAFFAVAGALFVGTIMRHELDERVEGIDVMAIPALGATLVFALIGGTTIAQGST